MTNNKLHCIPGDTIWAVERNEEGEPAEVSGVLYCATVVGFIIAAAFPDHGGIHAVLQDAAEDTAAGFGPEFFVYPEIDCFCDKAEAEKKLHYME